MGRPRIDPETRRNNENKAKSERKQWYEEHGICKSCGQESAEPGNKLCLLCKMKNRENVKAWRKKYPERYAETEKQHREKKRDKAQEWEALGLCTKCGKRKAESGRKKCARCLAIDNNSHKKGYRKKHGQKAWWECIRCTERALPGYRMCQRHYDKTVEAARKGNLASREKCRPYVDALWEGMIYDAGKAGKK